MLKLFEPEDGIEIVAEYVVIEKLLYCRFRLTLNSIIFVHGLFGDRCRTWTQPNPQLPSSPPPNDNEHVGSKWAKDVSLSIRKIIPGLKRDEEDAKVPARPTNVFWPRDLLPIEFPNCRIFTWGYDVNIDNTFSSASTATVFNHAGNLLTDLTDVRMKSAERERPLVFIAHSLGGIVVKDVRVHRTMGPTQSLIPLKSCNTRFPQRTFPILMLKTGRKPIAHISDSY